MTSSLMERLVIWRGWLCGANPAAIARVDSRIASFMIVAEVRNNARSMMLFDGGGRSAVDAS